MKKSNDKSILMESYKIQFEPTPSIVRSLTESFPKRFNTSKLLISGLYKIIGSSRVECAQHFVYAPEQRQAFNDLSRFDPITDLINLDFLPLKQLLQLLKTWDRPTSLSIYDHEDHKVNTILYEVANALHGVYPHLQTDLGKRYLDESLHSDLLNQHFPYFDDALVLQERPGKMIVWNPRKACEQAFSQKYKNILNDIAQKKGSKPPLLDVGRSQGLTSLIAWQGHDCHHTIHKSLSAFSFTLKNQGFDLAAPEYIAEQVWSFAKSLKLGQEGQKIHTYLSCPYQTVIQSLIQSFSKVLSPSVPSFKVHDVLTGYSSKLTFLSFLSSIEKNSVFVDLGSFPEVICVVAQNEGS